MSGGDVFADSPPAVVLAEWRVIPCPGPGIEAASASRAKDCAPIPPCAHCPEPGAVAVVRADRTPERVCVLHALSENSRAWR